VTLEQIVILGLLLVVLVLSFWCNMLYGDVQLAKEMRRLNADYIASLEKNNIETLREMHSITLKWASVQEKAVWAELNGRVKDNRIAELEAELVKLKGETH
jgi:hypothetical protein